MNGKAEQKESLTEHLIGINRNTIMTAMMILTAVVVISNFIAGVFTRIDANESVANVLADSVGAVLVFNDAPSATELLTSLRNSPEVIRSAIYTTDHSRFAEYGNTNNTSSPAQLRIKPDSTVWHPLYVEITKNIQHEEQNVGTLYLQVQLKSLYFQLSLELLIIWIAAAIGLLVARHRSRHLSQQALVPLTELTTLMDKVSGEADFSVRAGSSNIQELSTLAKGFNTMLEEIQSRDKRLLEQQENLEETVSIRTNDLQRAVKDAFDANQAKSHFLATMSHEIRTPMNGVLGMAELLMASKIGDEQRQLAHIIQQSGTQLLAIINDILDFSKIESGHMNLEQIEFDMESLINEVLTLFKQTALSKNLRLDTTIHPSPYPHLLVGDPLRLRQIFTNLLGNALKFTKRGYVELKVEIATNTEGKANIRLCVEDSGVGISSEAQAHIFDRFSQADSSTTRQFGGTGLGLAICKRLIELMEGNIWVESTLEQGTKFWITLDLPIATRQTFVTDKSLPPPTAASGQFSQLAVTSPIKLQGKILLAEDNPINQRLAQAMLTKLGLETEIGHNGAEAVELATSKHYDLILMDCQMPVMDGFQATQQIREIMQKSDTYVPIVALTANAMEGDQERCLAAGMDDYMSKPYTMKQMAATLQRWLAASPSSISLVNAAPSFESDEHEDSSPNEKLINREFINQLGAIFPESRNKLLQELLQAFMTNSATLLSRLEEAVSTQDSEALYQTANSLKASATHIGAEILSEKCLHLEIYGRRNQLLAAAKLLPDLQKCYQLSMTELQTILDEQET